MTHTIPLKLLTIDNEGFHLMLTGSINGYAVHLLIDTGATLTVLDINRIKKIYPDKEYPRCEKFFMGIGSGNIDIFSANIEKIELAECHIFNKNVILMDMNAINKAYASFDLPRVDGILGGDIMHYHKAKIDYEAQTMILNDL